MARVWVTTVEEVAHPTRTKILNGVESPETRPRPRGLPMSVSSSWAGLSIYDSQIDPSFVVAIARNLNTSPSFGRDFGDPTNPLFHTEALGLAATTEIETWIGLEEGEMENVTRAEAMRAILAGEEAPPDTPWMGTGIRLFEKTTRRMRRWRRTADRAWFSGLPRGQRDFVQALTDAQKDILFDTPVDDREALMQGWQ